MTYKILLVDDEPDILDFLSYNLKKEDYEVTTARNGAEAVIKVDEFKPDLILMDVMMPEMDGIEACKEIRKKPENHDIIIAFLTARGEDFSQIAAYEAGGDDYIQKPIKPKILVSKIKSLLRRKMSSNESTYKENGEKKKIGNIIIDSERYMVIKEDKEIQLPKKEFELLNLLASNPEKVFRREEIYSAVWGDDIFVGDRTIDVHIRKIRQKLGDDIIKTVKGVGYRFSG
jgi:two-component system alkaline phosphatase synthesis response regulator PhoP